MYKCNKCGNVSDFEEQNVYKTYVNQINNNDISTSDEFFYRENVVCLECDSTLEDGNVVEDYELNNTTYNDVVLCCIK